MSIEKVRGNIDNETLATSSLPGAFTEVIFGVIPQLGFALGVLTNPKGPVACGKSSPGSVQGTLASLS